MIASKISGIDKIGHLKNLSCKKSGTDDTRKKTSVEKRREREREGEAQNTTLHDKFSKFLTKS